MENIDVKNTETIDYNEDKIKKVEGIEHIRLRPGMYIGKLGDGKSKDDGIYVLIKETIDNSVDMFALGYGKNINVTAEDKKISIRDYGLGIPQGKLIDCVSIVNTGGKFDTSVFKRSIGLNGVGLKAVNALSSYFKVSSFRDGFEKTVEFSKGKLLNDYELTASPEATGTLVVFIPDEELFEKYSFNTDYIESMLRYYSYLNIGLTLNFNGTKFQSKNGLLDLLRDNITQEPLYPIIHLKDDDFEVSITHCSQYAEEYYSFVNGQNTTQGGTHLSCFKEAYVKTIKDFFKKDFDPSDVRQSIVAAISIKIEE